MKTALVTGSTGFIGRRLCARLVKDGWKVHRLITDIRDSNAFETSSQIGDYRADRFDKAPDVIFHLASYGNSPEHTSITRIYETNVMGTLNLLARFPETVPVVFASSSSVYGYRPIDKPMTEDDAPEPNSHYAISKLAVEQMLLRRGKASILRFFSVYGPGEAEYRLIPTVRRMLLEHKDITVDRAAVRDFVHVDDAIEALIQLSQFQGVFNVGSGKSWLVSDVARIMMTVFNPGRVKLIESPNQLRPWESPYWRANTEKAFCAGWKTKINLIDGLKDYINGDEE